MENPAYVQDALVNLATGMGGIKDRSRYTFREFEPFDHIKHTYGYIGDWLVRRIIDTPVEDALRKRRKITCPSITPEQIKEFATAERALGLWKRIESALRWGRLYGGAVMCPVMTVGKPADVLNIEALPVGCLHNWVALSRVSLSIASVGVDPFNPATFDKPSAYRVNATGGFIDPSRCAVFEGFDALSEVKQLNGYWGFSVLSGMWDSIERCSTVSAALTQLLDEANVDVLSIKGLYAKLTNQASADALKKRFGEGNLIKSLYGMMLLDSDGETYERHELSGSMTGLVDLLKQFYQAPSAAAGIPVTRLLGVSPGGLNATGESDLANYYDMVDSIRTTQIAEALELSDAILCRHLFGRTFRDWAYEWEPLWQQSDNEAADVLVKRSQAYNSYVASGIIPPSVVAAQLLSDGVFVALDQEFVDTLAEIEEEDAAVPEPLPGLVPPGLAQPTRALEAVDPEVEPVDPEVEPVDPEVEPVDPEVEPVDPEVEPVDPEVEPVDPEVEPVDPEVEAVEHEKLPKKKRK